MKKLKYILSAIILVLCVMVPAFALVGCKKHYTVSVSVVEGEGDVTRVDQLSTKHSLIGTNDLEEGARFEYSVVPATGYQIKYIKVDGTEIAYTISDADNDKGAYIARPLLTEHISSDHTIQVAFEKRTYFLTFAFGGNSQNVLKDSNNKEIKVGGTYLTKLNQIVSNIADGNFYSVDPDIGKVDVSAETQIAKDMLLITDLDEAHLRELLDSVING